MFFWPLLNSGSLPSANPEVLPSATPVNVEIANQVQQISWHLDWGTVLAGIIAGAAAGVLIVIMQVLGDFLLHKFEKWRESKAKILITFPHERRYIDGKIFEELKPGRSVEYMKTALGSPAMTFAEVAPIFPSDTFYHPDRYEPMTFENDDEQQKYSDEYHSTTAYVYQFMNAVVKITSKDKEVIDSLAVEHTGLDVGLDVPQLPLGWGEENLILGRSKVTKDLIEECQKFGYESSRFEDKMVLCLYTGSPLYTYYSYFGVPDYDEKNPTDADKPETFIGGTINGVCLHSEEHKCYVVRHWDYE